MTKRDETGFPMSGREENGASRPDDKAKTQGSAHAARIVWFCETPHCGNDGVWPGKPNARCANCGGRVWVAREEVA